MTQLLQKQVVIQNVEKNWRNTRNGGKNVYDLHASDGNRYSTWDENLGERLLVSRSEPATIYYTERQNGQYTNYDLQSVEFSQVPQAQLAMGQPMPTGNTSTAGYQGRIDAPPSDKDAFIARSTAIKAVPAWLAYMPTDKRTLRHGLMLAETLARFQLGTLDIPSNETATVQPNTSERPQFESDDEIPF